MKTSRFISLLLCVVMIMSLFTGLAGSASADDVIVHEVQSGEILLKICEKHGLNYYACKNAIMALNGFASEADMGRLSVGQKIKLPASDAVAGTVSTSTAVVTSTTVGGTTMTTTTSYVGTTAAGGNIAYYLTAYTVQAGDTLAGICGKLNSNYYYYAPVILAVNSLANANYIRPGQVLLIPTPSAGGTGYAVVAHQVQPGETMTAICNRYGVSYQAMRTLINGLNRRDNMDKIYVGQTVYVPTTGAGAVSSAVVVSGTTTTTTSGTPAAGAGYTITFATGGAFASANGKDYVSSAPAGVEVSVWSNVKSGYAVKSLEVIRTDTGAPVPVDYNYFTMPNSNVYVDVAFEKGLSITKAKAQGGSFETSVSGFLSDAAFPGDIVTVLAYPNQYYSVKSVSYQKTDGTVSAVDVKKDASGNYSFTMPSYPIKLSVAFAPTQYHTVSYSGTIGNGKVTFTVGNKEVKQVEQGETVTMKFVPDKNWAFNTSDFENNLATHIPNRSSMGSFKKIDDTTYTFVMGTKDINVVGVQFLNRSVYTISGSIWKGTNNSNNGSIYFNVIDQTTGSITYKTNKAKFGDTVQVIFVPAKNYVNDAQYAKDNSKGAGNALLSWSSDNTFTMPDSNVTVNARFVQDGGTHTYSGISRSLIPAAGGTVDFIFDGCVMDTAEVGKVVTVKVYPKPNYDVSVAKIIGGNTIYAVSLNGKLVGEAPAASNFVQIDPYTYSFVKGSGTDTIRVAFASDYQGVNATFTQVTEGGDPVVQGIKGFAINGSYVQGDAQVIYGDTVSFSIDLKEGYEITSVRKYVRDKDKTPPADEVANTTAYIPGGKNNSYSYTVTRDDISSVNSVIAAGGTGELVFEITCRKNPETYYTVKYTQPKINGKTPIGVDSGTDAFYSIAVQRISDSTFIIPLASADAVGISGNLVEANDIMVYIVIPSEDVYVTDSATLQKMYYSFDKLLLNGTEFAPLEEIELVGKKYKTASYILPKDTPDGILTTELVYKLYKTEDANPIALTDLEIGGTALVLTPGTYDYTFNATATPQTIKGTYNDKPDSAEIWVNDVLLNTDSNKDTTLDCPTDANWVTGPNKLVIKLHKSDMTDTVYTVTVNYGMEDSVLTELKVGWNEVTPSVTDPAHPAALTIYEATVDKATSTVTLNAAAFQKATWDLNGEKIYIDDVATSKSIDWVPGDNTLKISVTETGKAPTTYVVHVNCALPDSSKLATLKINNAVNGPAIDLVPGQLNYTATVAFAETSKIDITTSGSADISTFINGTLAKEDTGVMSQSIDMNTLTPKIIWENGANTILIKVKENDKTETTYTVKVTCSKEASAFKTIQMDGDEILAVGKTAYNLTAKEATSSFKVESVSGTSQITWSLDGGPETVATTEPYSFNVTWLKANGNKVVIKVKEEGKTETTYTLTVAKKQDPSTLEDYLIIDGDTVKFSGSHTASYTTLGLYSDVTVTLTPPASNIESVKLEINGTLTDIAPTTGTDAHGNVTYDYANVSWKPGANAMKVYVKYLEQAETAYTVSVNSKADNLALSSVVITGLTPNYKGGASGVKLYGDTDTVTATAVDPTANVTINVYGATVMAPVTGIGGATVTGIAWNTDGNESNRIDIIVENGGYTKTWSITGVYSGPTHP